MADTRFTPQQIEEFLQEFFDVVGARQYIGARYVPIFGRAGEGTVEWDDGAPYEPLTVVMHEGVSYVSRRYVPAGIQITDTAYWVDTYRFNAQVEQYRQEVLRYEEDVDGLASHVDEDMVPFPDMTHYPKYGTLGQVLSTLADGETKWVDPVVPSDEQAEAVIESWLDAHPEAVVNIQPESVVTDDMKPHNVVMPYDSAVTGDDFASVNDFPNNYVVRFQSVSPNPIADLPTDAPTAITHGVVVTFSPSSVGPDAYDYVGFRFQILATYGSGDETRRTFYLRSCWAGGLGWSPWVRVTTSTNFPSMFAAQSIQASQVPDGLVTDAKIAAHNAVKPYGGTVHASDFASVNDFPNNYVVKFESYPTVIADLPTDAPSAITHGVVATFSPVNVGPSEQQYAGFRMQLLAAFGSADETRRTFYLRSCWSGGIGWTSWVKVLTPSNFASQQIQASQVPDGLVTAGMVADYNAVKPYDSAVTGDDFASVNDFPNNYVVRFQSVSPSTIADLPTDAPTAITHGTVVTFSPSSVGPDSYDYVGFRIQLLSAFGSGDELRRTFYLRSCWAAGIGWTPWVRLTTSSNELDKVNPDPDSYGNLYNLNAAKKIVLLGDSITAGYGSTGYVQYNTTIDGRTVNVCGNGPDYPSAGPGYQVGELLYEVPERQWYTSIDGHGWAQLLKSYLEAKFPNTTVTNDGMIGINSTDLSHFLEDLIVGKGYDLALVMYGTNNRLAERFSSLYSDMVTCVNTLKANKVRPILMCCVPASVTNEADYPKHMEDVEHTLKNVAMACHVPFVNLYEEFMDYCWVSGTTIDSLLMDGLHPSDAGYEVMFNLITKALGLSRKRPGATW